MKITDVRVKRYSVSRDVRAYAGDIHVVEVHTDAGVTGLGFMPAASATSDVAATLVRRPLKAAVVGENPLLTDDLWRRMHEAVPRRGGEGIVRTCMAGVDFALWDLKGKLLDAPLSERLGLMRQLLPGTITVPRELCTNPEEAAETFRDAVRRGYEGVVIKNLDAPYAAGRRDSAWVKVKPRHTFDLIVTAAEWGHGRRQGWLSNLHLAARDPASGELIMLGKTFKGLTDELLSWQTARFLELEIRRTAGTVYVEPSTVVEIACDGLQVSTRYPGGVALRFARVLRYRPDKSAAEADTIDTVKVLSPIIDGP